MTFYNWFRITIISLLEISQINMLALFKIKKGQLQTIGGYAGIVLIFLIFCYQVIANRSAYSYAYNYQDAQQLYENSQFSSDLSKRSQIINDEDLYAYAGYSYLTQGGLDTINIEHPPLGKYLFGISILLFHNPNIIQIPLAALLLFLLYRISHKILGNTILAALIPLALLFENLFKTQLTHSLLDLPQATMIALFILILMSRSSSLINQSIKLGLVLGAVASIKYPATALLLTCVYLINLLKNSEKIKSVLISTIILGSTALSFFLLMYIPLLINQGIGGFVATQIGALRIHLSHVPEYPPLAPLKVLLFNQWPVWFDAAHPIHTLTEWNFLWPVLGIGVLISPLVLTLISKKPSKIFPLLLFTWLYFAFINSRLFFPAYLFLILPYLYLILLWEICLVKRKIKLHIFRAVTI